MGWTLRGVRFLHGTAVATVDSDGNNVAWVCPCGAPVLLIYQRGRRGSAPSRPAICGSCGNRYHLDPPYGSQPEPPRGQPVVPATLMTLR